MLGRRYLVWRVRIAGFGFNSGPTYPIGCQNFQRPAPSSDLENIILVTASLDLTQQKKLQMSKNWPVWTSNPELLVLWFWFFFSKCLKPTHNSMDYYFLKLPNTRMDITLESWTYICLPKWVLLENLKHPHQTLRISEKSFVMLPHFCLNVWVIGWKMKNK